MQRYLYLARRLLAGLAVFWTEAATRKLGCACQAYSSEVSLIW